MSGTNAKPLLDKVAVVTGAGSGIGAATAVRLVQDGARVVGLGRTESKLIDLVKRDPQALSYTVADITDAELIAQVIDDVAVRFGRLDILVNNAALDTRGSTAEVDPGLWRRTMAATVDGAYFASRAAVPYLSSSPDGSIVNVGSVSALRGDRDHVAYNAAKGALANLTNAMALDHGRQFRVNAVHPGLTLHTEITAHSEAYPEIFAEFARYVPVGRLAEPEDVADVIAFLVGPGARYVNGAHIPVDGGLLASVGHPIFSV
jgi:meso-butanediol dehydrogenase / (S,S)-butanediol dehydrogenase / diacetyl reductase